MKKGRVLLLAVVLAMLVCLMPLSAQASEEPRLFVKQLRYDSSLSLYEPQGTSMLTEMELSRNDLFPYVFYFGTEDQAVRVPQSDLKASGSIQFMNYAGTSIKADDKGYYIYIRSTDFGEGFVTYTDADGTEYSVDFHVLFPYAGFYSEPILNEAYYINTYRTTENGSNTFYLIPRDGYTITSFSADADFAAIADFRLSDENYITVTMTGTPEEAKVRTQYGITLDLKKPGFSIMGVYAGIFLENGTPKLMCKNVYWNGILNKYYESPDAFYLRTWEPAPGDSEMVVFRYGVEGGSSTVLSMEELVFPDNIRAEEVDGVIRLEALDFGSGTICYTGGSGSNSIPVNVKLPRIGFYSADEASEGNYIVSFSVTEESRSFYILPVSGVYTISKVELDEAFDAIANCSISHDGTYAVITVTGTPDGSQYEAVVYYTVPGSASPYQAIRTITLYSGLPAEPDVSTEPDIPAVLELHFSDVSPDDWFHDTVYAAANAGIIAGNADGTYAPDGRLSWAQAVTFAVRLAQYKADEPIYGAADQTGANWYDVYVNYAKGHGFISSVPADPDAPITRGGAAVLFAAVLGEAEPVNDVPEGCFTDVPTGGEVHDAVYALAKAGICNGMGGGIFGVDSNFLRSEVAAIAARMAGLVDPAQLR